MRKRLNVAVFVFPVVLLWSTLSPAAYTAWHDSVGYNYLVSELTAGSITVPTGSGIAVTQVEADATSGTTTYDKETLAYKPDSTNSEFNSKTFTYKTTVANYLALWPTSGVTSVINSTHATDVGKYLYGTTSSISPSISSITSWEANHWINTGLSTSYTYTSSTTTGGTTTSKYALSSIASETSDIVNHSWVGSSSNSATIVKLFDYSINQDDYVAVVGVNNGSTTTLPGLMCQGYNSISVGITSGVHSAGLTTVNNSGRRKPDIVAPGGATSYATPMVGSAAAMLLQKGKSISTNAAHSETIKAILMAGATKDVKDPFVVSTISKWQNSSTSPLDSTYGAGELNVYRSYKILTGGEQESGGTISTMGWDYGTATGGSQDFYYFNVAANSVLNDFSALLTWNALVSGTATEISWGMGQNKQSTTTYDYTTTVANLALNLYSVAIDGTKTLLQYSNSAVDNVELIHLSSSSSLAIGEGNYAIGVAPDSLLGADYALAWYMTAAAVPEPASIVLLLTAGGAAWYWRRRGRVKR